ncbi:UNVERIFIED_CONTAM: L-threonate dehydrogenase [Sesamum indicum]
MEIGEGNKEDYQMEIIVDMHASKAVSEVLNGKVMIISSGQAESISRAQPFLSGPLSFSFRFFLSNSCLQITRKLYVIFIVHTAEFNFCSVAAMGDKLFLFEGDIGAGSKSKMVIELLEEIHFVASLEAMSLGAQAGIHPRIIYDIISNAAGNSCVKNKVMEVQEQDGTERFIDLRCKLSSSG